MKERQRMCHDGWPAHIRARILEPAYPTDLATLILSQVLGTPTIAAQVPRVAHHPTALKSWVRAHLPAVVTAMHDNTFARVLLQHTDVPPDARELHPFAPFPTMLHSPLPFRIQAMIGRDKVEAYRISSSFWLSSITLLHTADTAHQSFMEDLRPPIPFDPQGLVALKFLSSYSWTGGKRGIKNPIRSCKDLLLGLGEYLALWLPGAKMSEQSVQRTQWQQPKQSKAHSPFYHS